MDAVLNIENLGVATAVAAYYVPSKFYTSEIATRMVIGTAIGVTGRFITDSWETNPVRSGVAAVGFALSIIGLGVYRLGPKYFS